MMASGSRSRRASFIERPDFGLAIGAEPVRKIRPRTGRQTMPGWFPTRKGTLPSLRTETLTELDGLAHFEVNPDCVLMATQPHRLEYHEPQGDGTTIRRSYTPDVALLLKDGTIVVVDFKPAEYARRTKWRRKEEILADAYDRDHHAVFRTVTDAAVRVEPRRTNVSILLMRRPVLPDREADVAIMAALMRLGFPTTIGALADQVHLPSDQPHADRPLAAIVKLALEGVVRLDLGRPLGRVTLVTAPAGETGMTAWPAP